MRKNLNYIQKSQMLDLKWLSRTYSFLAAFLLVIFSSVGYTDGFPFMSPVLSVNLFVPRSLDMAIYNKTGFNTQYSGHFMESSAKNTKKTNDLIKEFQRNNYGVLSSTDIVNRMIVFVINNLNYDIDYTLIGLNDAVADGYGVCWHYAYLFSVLCNSYNIQNEVLYGKLGKDEIAHVWNRVKLDNQYYYFDLTWFDNNSLKNSLWCTEAEMKSLLNYSKFRVVWPQSHKTSSYQE